MTMPCETVQEMLTPLLDDELDREGRIVVDTHVATCPLCREELWRLTDSRSLSQEAFRDVLVSASPCPEAVVRALGSRGRFSIRRVPIKSLIAAAAIVLVFFVVVFSPRHEKPLSAAELIEKATRALADHDDAEIQVTLKTPFFNALLSDPKKKPDIPQFRLLVTRKNQLLLLPSGDRVELEKTSGFDGKTFWSFDPKSNEVRLLSEAALAKRDANGVEGSSFMGKDGTFKPKRLLEFLSWDRFSRLDQDFDWREVREGIDGRRVFEAKAIPTDKENQNAPVKNALVTLTLTIDPREGLVESLHIVYRYFGVDVIAIDFDLIALDTHPPAEVFSFTSHVTKDAKIIRDSGEGDGTGNEK